MEYFHKNYPLRTSDTQYKVLQWTKEYSVEESQVKVEGGTDSSASMSWLLAGIHKAGSG